MGRGIVNLLLIAALCTTTAPANVITYLPNLAGDTESAAQQINNDGVVVGWSAALDIPSPFGGFERSFDAVRWANVSAAQSLGGSTSRSIAYAINSSGVIAGESNGAFRWADPGPLQNLGGTTFIANAINASGEIVGASGSNSSPLAFRKTAAGPVEVFTLPSGAIQGYAHDINDSGTIVGWYQTTTSQLSRRGFYRPAGGAATLLNSNASEAVAINNSGVIVGSLVNPVGSSTSFRTTVGGSLVPLPTLSSFGSTVRDINEGGYVVGLMRTSASVPNDNHALLWKPDNSVIDLDQWLNTTDPVEGAKWRLWFAEGINDFGQVVGYGDYNDGAGGLVDGQRGFVLDVNAIAPEPAGLTLFSILPLLLRRRSNKPTTTR